MEQSGEATNKNIKTIRLTDFQNIQIRIVKMQKDICRTIKPEIINPKEVKSELQVKISSCMH